MSDPRPAFHCGASQCCEGQAFPECQENFSLGHPASTHYEDDTTGQDVCPCTD